jgi:uncharacterized membrane protein YraQ (UPF0718 family)
MNAPDQHHSSIDARDAVIIISIFSLLAIGLIAFMTSNTFFSWFSQNTPDTWPSKLAPVFGDMLTLTLSIIVEAIPFIFLGVLFSVAIQQFLPTEKLIKKLPRNRFIRRIIISCLGVFMPVCECGNVPVARSLIRNGMSVPESVVFLLAAPIINPVTILATAAAFSFSPSVVAWRVGAGFIIANIVGSLIGRLGKQDELLTPEFQKLCEAPHHNRKSWKTSVSLFQSESWIVFRMLCIGALIAGASQVFIPRDIITAIGSNPILSIIAMLILAFVISICSSVDAFFALAYVQSFSIGSIVAFLVAGPMVDIKMLTIMKTTYRWRVLAVITGSVMILSFITGLAVNNV